MEKCALLRTDNVQGQISKLFSCYCVYYPSNIFCVTHGLKIGEYPRIFPSFSWEILSHMMRLDQSGANKNICFTITAEILPCSLVNFIVNMQTHEFIIYAIHQQDRAASLAICYHKKQIDVSFSCFCPAIDNGFCHNMSSVIYS